jgi:hypothetical protein
MKQFFLENWFLVLVTIAVGYQATPSNARVDKILEAHAVQVVR